MVQRYATNSVFLALTAMWVAVVLVCALFPAFPILGTAAVVTVGSVVAAGLTAPILGLQWGTMAGFIYGWLVPVVNPATAIFGPLTFLSPTMGALISGLVLFDRWREALLIFCVEVVVWFLNPFAWYQAMPVITWEYWLAMGLIIVSPIRKWLVRAFKSRNPVTLPIALFCLAWIARVGGDVLTGNNLSVWVFNFGGPGNYGFWVPMTVYYAVADSLICVFAAIGGTIVLLALKAANLRFIAVDFLESKTKS